MEPRDDSQNPPAREAMPGKTPGSAEGTPTIEHPPPQIDPGKTPGSAEGEETRHSE
jgi:hypothetical protein